MSKPDERSYEMKADSHAGLGTPMVEPPLSRDVPEGGISTITEDEIDVIPEGGYGWVIVICVALVNAVTWGVNTTYGVFASFYQQYDYFNASVLDYAWVGGLSVAVSLVVAPLANWIVRQYGFKTSMYIGTVFVVLGQCLAGLTHSFGPFLVFQGVIFGIGLGLTFIAVVPVAAHWFDRRLALAQGLSAAGSGLGGLVLSNSTRAALEHLGVKWALVINGLISLVVLLPCIYLLKGRHKAVKARSAPFQVKWFVHPGLIWVLGWGIFASESLGFIRSSHADSQ